MAKILTANKVSCFNQVLLEDPLLDILITEATEVIPTYSKCVHCCLCLASSPGPTQKRRRALSHYSLIPRPHPLRRTSHMCWVSKWCNSTCLTCYHIVASQLQLEFLWQDHRSYSIECSDVLHVFGSHMTPLVWRPHEHSTVVLSPAISCCMNQGGQGSVSSSLGAGTEQYSWSQPATTADKQSKTTGQSFSIAAVWALKLTV